jgi:hypothetical protein
MIKKAMNKNYLKGCIISLLVIIFCILASVGFEAEHEYEQKQQQLLIEMNKLDIKLQKGEISQNDYNLEYSYLLKKYQ